MLYIIQDVVYVSVQKYTLILHCDPLVNTTYKNMGFDRYDNFDENIIEYFQLVDYYKNGSMHMMFINKNIIETREYVYENKTYTEFPNINFIKSSESYFQCILIFIKNEQFTPFEDGRIKYWNISHVNTKKEIQLFRSFKVYS